MHLNDSACPCGSGARFADCCGPVLAGTPALSAERLMRARYSAYVLGDAGFLRESWHVSTRPQTIDPAQGPVWLGLEVRATSAGQPGDDTGMVEFIARYRDGTRVDALHETSRFVREQGRWFYVDGQIHPTTATRAGRNDPCPCGSGRKFKRCCG
ncbi:MAG: YchJ family protein [Thiohalomonadaceae bacterium]